MPTGSPASGSLTNTRSPPHLIDPSVRTRRTACQASYQGSSNRSGQGRGEGSQKAAGGYALIYGFITGRGEFLRNLLPTAARAMNLSAVVFFLVGSVGIFQFVAANQAWPQQLAQLVIEMQLEPLPFLFGYMALLLMLGTFLDGIAMILLTVPVVFPVATALGIDPIHLGIVVTMGVELSVITPPVGFNLYAVSGIAQIPIQTVLRGAMIFFVSDFLVTLIIILVPELSTWLPRVLGGASPFG